MGELIRVDGSAALSVHVTPSLVPSRAAIVSYVLGRVPELLRQPVVNAYGVYADVQTHIRLYREAAELYVAFAVPLIYEQILFENLERIRRSGLPQEHRDRATENLMRRAEQIGREKFGY